MMIMIRIVDVYWIVEPAFYGQQNQLKFTGWILCTPVAIGGLVARRCFSGN